MHLASALEITLSTAQVSFRFASRQHRLPRFYLRSQLLTRL